MRFLEVPKAVIPPTPRPVEAGRLEHLLPPSWKSQVTAWLSEDTPSFDYGGFVVGDADRTATLWAKSSGVLAGRPFFDEVLAQCGCSVQWHVEEGTMLTLAAPVGEEIERSGNKESGKPLRIKLASVQGPARGILLGERVSLNVLARCSGIATRSAALVAQVRAAGFTGHLAGTRKTTSGFRLVEKYGMLVGGADTHRMDLSSMVMLKDNHVWSRGGNIGDAVRAARAVAGFALKIEVEVQSEAEADQAVAAGADVVMLDNFPNHAVPLVAGNLKKRWAGERQFLLEVSDGLTADNVEPYSCQGRGTDDLIAVPRRTSHVARRFGRRS